MVPNTSALDDHIAVHVKYQKLIAKQTKITAQAQFVASMNTHYFPEVVKYLDHLILCFVYMKCSRINVPRESVLIDVN